MEATHQDDPPRSTHLVLGKEKSYMSKDSVSHSLCVTITGRNVYWFSSSKNGVSKDFYISKSKNILYGMDFAVS